MTLKQAEDICRANEKAHEGAAAMKEGKQVVERNAIYNQRKKLYPKPNNRDVNRHSDGQINSRQTHNNRASSVFNCIRVEPRTVQLGVRPVLNVGKEITSKEAPYAKEM